MLGEAINTSFNALCPRLAIAQLAEHETVEVYMPSMSHRNLGVSGSIPFGEIRCILPGPYLFVLLFQLFGIRSVN